MNLSGQAAILATWETNEEVGQTVITFTSETEEALGSITIETNRLKSFFEGMARVFSERAKFEGLPSSEQAEGKLLLRLNQQAAEVRFSG